MRSPSVLTRSALKTALAAIMSGGFGAAAWAEPTPGALGFQKGATENALILNNFHNQLLYITGAVVALVMVLLLWVMTRYNSKANPVPKKFSHNTLVEIIWTAGPVLILVYIAAQSFPLLYREDRFPKVAESQIVDVKVYGRQWYWSYSYGAGDNALELNSNLIPEIKLKPGQIRQLSVDNPMVVPASKYVRVSISASDVIHSWAMPAFVLKTDAIPGKLNQTWFKVDKPGAYYGQCSKLCGSRHAYMPIEVRVLPQAQFQEWLQLAKTSLAEGRKYLDEVQPLSPVSVAAAN